MPDYAYSQILRVGHRAEFRLGAYLVACVVFFCADYFCRRAAYDGIRRNIFGYHAICTDNTVRSDRDARTDVHMIPDPHEIPDQNAFRFRRQFAGFFKAGDARECRRAQMDVMCNGTTFSYANAGPFGMRG